MVQQCAVPTRPMSGSRFFCSLRTAILLNASEASSGFRSKRANSHPPLQFSLLLVTFNAIRMLSCPHAPSGMAELSLTCVLRNSPLPSQSLQLRKKLLDRVQRTGPFSSGNRICFRRSALPIHFRKIFFVPDTRTGEHPSPNNGLTAPRRLSSALNQSAHSGTTGSPNRCAMRYSTNFGSSSHSTVRLPSRSAPGRVFATSAERATRCRIGLRPRW